MGKPKVINWFYSGKCNLGCKFCYGKFNEDTLSLEEKKTIIDKISDAGVEKLTITGGEPLLGENLLEIIEYASEKNLFVSLHTNGILLDEKLIKALSKKVGRISLALDGAGNDVNLSMRGYENYFDLVNDLLKLIKKYNVPVSVKTVASKKNIESIPDLIPILAKYNPDIWLISEFRPERRGKEHQNEFLIINSEFKKLREKCKGAPLRIGMRSIEDGLNRPFFFIDSNGKVLTDYRGEYTNVGSIFEEEVGSLWDKIVELVPINDNYIKQPVVK